MRVICRIELNKDPVLYLECGMISEKTLEVKIDTHFYIKIT